MKKLLVLTLLVFSACGSGVVPEQSFANVIQVEEASEGGSYAERSSLDSYERTGHNEASLRAFYEVGYGEADGSYVIEYNNYGQLSKKSLSSEPGLIYFDQQSGTIVPGGTVPVYARDFSLKDLEKSGGQGAGYSSGNTYDFYNMQSTKEPGFYEEKFGKIGPADFDPKKMSGNGPFDMAVLNERYWEDVGSYTANNSSGNRTQGSGYVASVGPVVSVGGSRGYVERAGGVARFAGGASHVRDGAASSVEQPAKGYLENFSGSGTYSSYSDGRGYVENSGGVANFDLSGDDRGYLGNVGSVNNSSGFDRRGYVGSVGRVVSNGQSASSDGYLGNVGPIFGGTAAGGASGYIQSVDARTSQQRGEGFVSEGEGTNAEILGNIGFSKSGYVENHGYGGLCLEGFCF